MNRKALEAQFLSSSNGPWKTFVLEAHSGEGHQEFLSDVFGRASIRETEDSSLHQIVAPDLLVTVDHLDSRFWSFHTDRSAADFNALLRSVVARRRDLDFVWLPSAHLEHVQREVPPNWIKTEFTGKRVLPSDQVQDLAVTIRGRAAKSVLQLVSNGPEHSYAVSLSQLEVLVTDSDLGSIVEAVNRKALFVAKGGSFRLHQLVVEQVVQRYRRLVEVIEDMALGFAANLDSEEGGGRMTGGPIELRFSRPLPSLELLLEDLLSSREPYRLWGNAHFDGDDFAEVEAVDLHVGHRIRLEMSREMIRVHLRAGGCGNSVARLVSNLQHHVDGGIEAVDERIAEQLVLKQTVAA
jgi:hypothetical protein